MFFFQHSEFSSREVAKETIGGVFDFGEGVSIKFGCIFIHFLGFYNSTAFILACLNALNYAHNHFIKHRLIHQSAKHSKAGVSCRECLAILQSGPVVCIPVYLLTQKELGMKQGGRLVRALGL